MRILLASPHEYPALTSEGSGLLPKRFPSGSGYLLHDLLAKGLAELGHEVFYLVPHRWGEPVPTGVKLVREAVDEADILHTISDFHLDLVQAWAAKGKPWVATCHMHPGGYRRTPNPAETPAASSRHWIFVSQALAREHGRERHVWNGVDPAEYCYSETKENYLLFMSSMEWGLAKGLDVALALAEQSGVPLVVAGTATTPEKIERTAELCRSAKARYVGDVRGRHKAELLAGAKAFLFPTQVDEAFGLGIAEALISGTPVICSDRGACAEVISSEVGFVCSTTEDYLAAIARAGEITPAACRAKAMKDYHYRRMARGYVTEYKREMG